MKRFAFRLERLRELRERAERERAALLGAAMREEHERQMALERARLELARAGEQAADMAASQPLAAGTLGNFDFTRDVAAGRVDAAADAVRTAGERVDEEREHYGVARRDLRIVEKLKEKRFEAWREQGAREERKEADDVGNHRRVTQEGQP